MCKNYFFLSFSPHLNPTTQSSVFKEVSPPSVKKAGTDEGISGIGKQQASASHCQPQRGRGSFLPLGDPCSSVLRSSIHWALCFGLSRVTVPLYSSWSSSLHPERETPYNYERPESVIEPQNHKCLWFVANSKSCVQPQMVSHELGFISPWSGHIPGDPR